MPTAQRLRLICNRDEQSTRPHALDPRIQTVAEQQALFPIDPASGGTWIGANDAGLVLVLLNRTPAPARRVRRAAEQSRGIIIPALLRYAMLDEAVKHALTLPPRRFDPFSLIAIHDARAEVVTSDGEGLTHTGMALVRPVMFTSSSLGDAMVDAPRRALFEGMVVRASDGWVRGQSRFHRHQWRRCPALSVVMRRPDAQTVSRTVVDVTRRFITMRYTDLVGSTSARLPKGAA